MPILPAILASKTVTITATTEPNPSFIYEVEEDEENASFSLDIAKTASSDPFTGTFYIRRADSKDNFTI